MGQKRKAPTTSEEVPVKVAKVEEVEQEEEEEVPEVPPLVTKAVDLWFESDQLFNYTSTEQTEVSNILQQVTSCMLKLLDQTTCKH